MAKQVERELKTILTHFPPVSEPLSEEERFTAALAMTSALPERIFTGEYERLFGSDAEKAETEKAMPTAAAAAKNWRRNILNFLLI